MVPNSLWIEVFHGAGSSSGRPRKHGNASDGISHRT